MNSANPYFLLALLCLARVGIGQTSSVPPAQTPALPTATQSTVAQVEMPSDPAALLALAAKRNGLQNAGSVPLHLKATYQLFDDKGAVREVGTFEEFRASARKSKLIYASPSLNQTDYSTEAGLFRVGDQKWPDDPVAEARRMMYPEFPSPEVLSKHKLGLVERTGGGPKLNCVTLSSPKAGTTAWDWMYCFSPTAPILRIAESFQGADQTVYNGIVSASGAFVGRDCSFSELGKVRVRVHLDSLEALPQMEESVFAPPPGAVEIPRRVNVRGTVMAAKLLRKVTPEYPAVAKAARIQGTVVLEAIIGKDGRVGDLRTLSGPTPFIQAATDAVRQWTYEPYLLDGEPVEVETHINVVFMLGLVPTM